MEVKDDEAADMLFFDLVNTPDYQVLPEVSN